MSFLDEEKYSATLLKRKIMIVIINPLGVNPRPTEILFHDQKNWSIQVNSSLLLA